MFIDFVAENLRRWKIFERRSDERNVDRFCEDEFHEVNINGIINGGCGSDVIRRIGKIRRYESFGKLNEAEIFNHSLFNYSIK